jgi:sodium ion-translocating decarboxylase beta subunit
MPGQISLLVLGNWAFMTMVALGLAYLAIGQRIHPNFLIPAAAGILLANLPLPGIDAALAAFLRFFQSGLDAGVYPALILLCRGAGMDLGYLIAHPRQLFLGLLGTFAFLAITALGWFWGLPLPQAGGGALIGSGDGVPAIFLTGLLAREVVGPVGLTAFALVGLLPRLQNPLVQLVTTRQERMLRMPPTRKVTRRENLLFAVAGLVLTALLIPGAMALTGMFFLGNVLRESGVLERLSRTLTNRLGEILVMLLGLAVGTSCQAADFLSVTYAKIVVLGLGALTLVSLVGILAIKVGNLFFSQKINPLVGAAAVGLVPDAAQVAQILGRREDPHNNLYSHALASNQAALLAATLTSGLLWGILGGR